MVIAVLLFIVFWFSIDHQSTDNKPLQVEEKTHTPPQPQKKPVNITKHITTIKKIKPVQSKVVGATKHKITKLKKQEEKTPLIPQKQAIKSGKAPLISMPNNINSPPASPNSLNITKNKKSIESSARKVVIDFSGDSTYEQGLAVRLENELFSYLQENGILGAGVTVSGLIQTDIAAKNLHRLNSQATTIHLLNFKIKKLGEQQSLPDLSAVIEPTVNWKSFMEKAVADLSKKIVDITKLNETDGKYWAKIRPFTFGPLEQKP